MKNCEAKKSLANTMAKLKAFSILGVCNVQKNFNKNKAMQRYLCEVWQQSTE